MFTRKFVSYESEQNEAVPSRMSDPDQLEKKTRLQRHGPDSVHSWMTAGACGLSSFFASCAVRSGGFVFVAVQENWQTSRRDAAWPVLMMAAGTQASGVLSGPLAQRFTVRPVTIAGSIMSSIGLVLSSFAPSTTVLTVTLGAIHGIGAGMVIMSQPMCLVQHFIIHKGLATGLNFAGSALAFFVFPMLMEFLTELYGFRSAILLFGAISLNAMAFTLFVRQPDWLWRCTFASKSERVVTIGTAVPLLPLHRLHQRHSKSMSLQAMREICVTQQKKVRILSLLTMSLNRTAIFKRVEPPK
ncbi:monocarboxylate transporter 3-like isoform X1 [Dermacentor silvarum]|uniref:monocarboxylate transporter 3-like isoform X1 n=1 Tax=Dermacentor silvarum TaxID=543639 RepID=UPI0018977C95|nr:monocarboxylate transporter 3-like isoform X1 [Dermacentor silvarum]